MTRGLDPERRPVTARTDPLASAGAAVAWMVLINKPIYPFTI
jgi:hypothetical protein